MGHRGPCNTRPDAASMEKLWTFKCIEPGSDRPNLDNHDQLGAAFGRVPGADRPAMRQRHLPGEAEADAAAAFMGGVEGQEDVVAAVFGNARAIVPDLDARLAAAHSADREPDHWSVAVGGGANGVAQQVEHGLREQLRVTVDLQRLRADLRRRIDLPLA